MTLKDTRGFLDESKESLSKQLNKMPNKNKINPAGEDKTIEYAETMLHERGIMDADGCVWISVANSDELSINLNRDLYGPMIEQMLRSYPVFITLRADQAMSFYDNTNEHDQSYQKLIAKDEKDRFINIDKNFTGFNEIRKLKKSFMPEDKTSWQTLLLEKHYKELLICNINTEAEEDELLKAQETYRKSVIGSFYEIVDGISKYYTDIEKAEKYLSNEEMHTFCKEKMEELYDKHFTDVNKYYNWYGHLCHKELNYTITYLGRKIQINHYRNNLVGPRGGYTTWITGVGRVGEGAIAYLENAYTMTKNLLRELVDELLKRTMANIKEIEPQDGKSSEQIAKSLVVAMYEKLIKILNENTMRFCCTGPMIDGYYLRNAYNKTREALEVSEEYIGKYLPELEELNLEEIEPGDLHYLSIVKYTIWCIIAGVYSSTER